MLAWRAWEHRGHTDGIKLTEMVKKLIIIFSVRSARSVVKHKDTYLES
jgi:hypothetical protein